MDCVTLLGESVSKLFSAASVVSATVLQSIYSLVKHVSKWDVGEVLVAY